MWDPELSRRTNQTEEPRDTNSQTVQTGGPPRVPTRSPRPPVKNPYVARLPAARFQTASQSTPKIGPKLCVEDDIFKTTCEAKLAKSEAKKLKNQESYELRRLSDDRANAGLLS